jgi:hypothetical protein
MTTGNHLPPAATEDKRHHLQLISNVIERHSQASARTKGWTIAASGAAFGVAAFDGRWYISLLGLGAILVFLDQDTRYLREERKFVALYRAANEDKVAPFDMNKDAFKNQVASYWGILFSWSVFRFYFIFLVLGIAATVGGLLHAEDDDADRDRGRQPERPGITHRHDHHWQPPQPAPTRSPN